MRQKELRILTPTSMLGYGFPMEAFNRGLEMNPDVIAVDSGSTDSGPHKIALGSMTCTYEAYYKEIEILLTSGYERKIPVFISSAGGDGTGLHVDAFADIVKDIAKKKGKKIKMCLIYSDIDKNMVKKKLEEGKITPCGPVPELTLDEIDNAEAIVAQMGVEPFLKALDKYEYFDIIISGRAYDPVPIATMGIKKGFDPALCWHMGKIMECGALCAEPSGRVIFGVLKEDGFILEPMNPVERCKTYSVAAHTMYEKTHPFYLPGPGGTLDLSECKFEQVTDTAVKVSGSKFKESENYTIKLEGASIVGYRSICVAGIRDPILISQIDDVLEQVKSDVDDLFSEDKDEIQLLFHVYGKNGVMGELEFEKDNVPMELCVVLETVANTQEKANAICNKARTSLLHNPYKGRIATAGNVALPFTPLEIPLGKVCKFNIYHLMEVDDPTELFPIKVLEV